MKNDAIIAVVTLGFAVSAMSLTITKAFVFGWLRDFMSKWKYSGELFKCSYCMSHWVSFVLVAIYQPIVIKSSFWIVDLAISAFVVVALSTMITWVVFNSYKRLDVENPLIEQLSQALRKAREKIVEQDAALRSIRDKASDQSGAQ